MCRQAASRRRQKAGLNMVERIVYIGALATLTFGDGQAVDKAHKVRPAQLLATLNGKLITHGPNIAPDRPR